MRAASQQPAPGPLDPRLAGHNDDEAVGVIVVASYPSVRAGLRALIAEAPGLVVLADTPDVEVDAPTAPDALLIDIDPGRPSIPARLAERYPDAVQALLLETPNDAWRIMATVAQARAFLLKDAGPDEIAPAIRAAAAGLVVLHPGVAYARLARPSAADFGADKDDSLIEPLTERERQVLELLALGLPNKMIAMELGVSGHTAKFHVGSIMSKLGAASRTEAVAIAARRGLLVL